MKNVRNIFRYSIRSLRFLWRHSREYVLLTVTQMLLGAASVFPGIFLVSHTVDMITQNLPFSDYLRGLLLLIALIFLTELCKRIVNTRIGFIKQRMMADIRLEIDGICLRTVYETIQSKQFQENKSFALTALDENCLDLFIQSVQQLVSSILVMAGVLAILAQVSYWILIPLALSLAIGFYYDYLNARQNFGELKERAEYQRKSAYMYNVSRSFEYAKEIRLFQLKDRFRKRMDEVDDLLFRFREAQRKQREPSAILYHASDAILNVSAYLYLGWMVLSAGTLTVGGFTACHQSLRQLKSSLEDIIYVLTNYVVHTESLKNFFDFMEQETMPAGDSTAERMTSAKIRFDHVSYRYPGAESDALHDVTLTVENGEKLLVVGENGAGKSTFVKLLCGLYQPTSGVIYLNDIDIQTMEPQEYRRQLSAVFQDYALFALTIEENVDSLHEEWRDTVSDALDQVQMKELVEATPHGTDTALYRVFDKEGVEFSGGEMQRLAIARAVCKDAPILVLDEPTSALDPRAEYGIHQSFRRIATDRTTVFVSHRMTSARFCDKIAVFSHGRIKEYGTHEELMANKGTYAELYSLQASLYQEGQS